MNNQTNQEQQPKFGWYVVAYLLGIATVLGFQYMVPNFKNQPLAKTKFEQNQRLVQTDEVSVTYDFIDTLKNQKVEVPAQQKTTKATVEFLLQAGSFRTILQAQEMVKKLESNGLPSFVESAETSSGIWYRVRLGPFYKKTEVSSVKNRMIEIGVRPIVVNREVTFQ